MTNQFLPVEQFVRRDLLRMALAASPFLALPSAAQSAGDLQSWLDARRVVRGPVILPSAATPMTISGPVRVPTGMELVVCRDLYGTPAAALILTGTTRLRFENAHALNVPIRIDNGSVSVSGFDYRGTDHLAAILIAGPGPYHDLRIDGLRVTDANYGILRQGKTSRLTGAVIRGGRFRNLRGDAIEWNVCPNDSDVLVEDHRIEGVNDPLGRPNWGIGIGFAGDAYSRNWDRQVMVKRFIIRDITGSALRQLIHVEGGADFLIERIRGSDIGARYSASSNMPAAFVACYGCTDFTLRDAQSDSGAVLVYAAAVGGRYVVPSANFTLADIALDRGDIRTEIGGPTAFGQIERIRLGHGSLLLRGQVRQLALRDIDITSSADVDPIRQEPGFLTGPLARFVPDRPQIVRNRITARRGAIR